MPDTQRQPIRVSAPGDLTSNVLVDSHKARQKRISGIVWCSIERYGKRKAKQTHTWLQIGSFHPLATCMRPSASDLPAQKFDPVSSESARAPRVRGLRAVKQSDPAIGEKSGLPRSGAKCLAAQLSKLASADLAGYSANIQASVSMSRTAVPVVAAACLGLGATGALLPEAWCKGHLLQDPTIATPP